MVRNVQFDPVTKSKSSAFLSSSLFSFVSVSFIANHETQHKSIIIDSIRTDLAFEFPYFLCSYLSVSCRPSLISTYYHWSNSKTDTTFFNSSKIFYADRKFIKSKKRKTNEWKSEKNKLHWQCDTKEMLCLEINQPTSLRVNKNNIFRHLEIPIYIRWNQK